MEVWGSSLTNIKTTLQLLSNSHKLDSRPEIRPIDLRYPERPTPAVYVPPVFPNGLEPLLEQVDGLAHLDLVYGRIIVVAPEVLDGLDLGTELLEGCCVGSICGFLLVFLLPI